MDSCNDVVPKITARWKHKNKRPLDETRSSRRLITDWWNWMWYRHINDCYGMKDGKFPLASMFVFLVVAQTLCFIQFSFQFQFLFSLFFTCIYDILTDNLKHFISYGWTCRSPQTVLWTLISSIRILDQKRLSRILQRTAQIIKEEDNHCTFRLIWNAYDYGYDFSSLHLH